MIITNLKDPTTGPFRSKSEHNSIHCKI